MTREQYEQHKRRLEEQLRAGIRLLESAYQAQVRALDLVWMLQAEGAGAGTETTVSSPAAPRAPETYQPYGQKTYDTRDAIFSSFYRLPERFTRTDVCKMLGYEPERGALFRILKELVDKGHLRIAERGSGKRATVYAKTEAEVLSSG